MHIVKKPKILNIDDEGYPIQPYGVKENPFSIIDISDIMYVSAYTGYSRMIKNQDNDIKPDKFFQ